MKQSIAITLASILVVIVLAESGALNSLLMFLLVGAIPGTHYAVPAGFMLIVIALCIWIALARFTVFSVLRRFVMRRLTKQKATVKKRLPRHRYAQLTQ